MMSIDRSGGAFGNALVWGVAWSALWVVAVVGFTVLGLLGVTPGLSWADALASAVRFGVAFGIIGFVAGGAFSGVFRLRYHGRRLSELSWVRIGIGGGTMAGLLVPVFLQAMNWISGDGFVPWGLVLDDALLAALFGSVAASGSIKIAQLSGALLPAPDPDEGDRAEAPDGRLEEGGWA